MGRLSNMVVGLVCAAIGAMALVVAWAMIAGAVVSWVTWALVALGAICVLVGVALALEGHR